MMKGNAMTDPLRRRCELLVGNREILKREFKFDDPFFSMICAGLFASNNAIVDTSKIELCRRLIKDNTKFNSLYRSPGKTSFAMLLAVEDDPKAILFRTLDAYKALRKYFPNSYYTAMSACIFAKNSSRPVAELAARAHAIYKLMKSVNRRETSWRDVVYAAVRATEDKLNAEIALAEQACSADIDGILPKSLKRRVVHNIALFGEDHERAGRRLSALMRLMREQKYRYGKGYELNVLTVLAMTEIPESDIVEDIIEVYEYLRERREFSRFVKKRALLMLAAFAVLDENMTPSRTVATSTAAVSTLAEYATLLVAAQACCC